jgi:competence protein ComEC
LALVPIALIGLIKDYVIFEHITAVIDHTLHFSLKKGAVNFINSHYQVQTAGFINLVMFNIKDQATWPIYDEMIDLSVVYLIVISGFHLSIFKQTIFKIFKHHHQLTYVISFCFLLLYCYFLNFAVSVTRVMLSLLIT